MGGSGASVSCQQGLDERSVPLLPACTHEDRFEVLALQEREPVADASSEAAGEWIRDQDRDARNLGRMRADRGDLEGFGLFVGTMTAARPREMDERVNLRAGRFEPLDVIERTDRAMHRLAREDRIGRAQVDAHLTSGRNERIHEVVAERARRADDDDRHQALEGRGFAVLAPHLAERVADLADGGLMAARFDHERDEVLVGRRGGDDRAE